MKLVLKFCVTSLKKNSLVTEQGTAPSVMQSINLEIFSNLVTDDSLIFTGGDTLEED